MSRSTIDEQVVKMSFDNSNFDSNINSSIKSLNKLDYRLNTLQKGNGFSNLTNSMNNLANTFSIKGQIMFGILTRLGNKIADLGSKAFGKLFSGIRDGLHEYDLLIESTQTIYENVKQSGKNIDDVNNALDTLNDYADKTIYNFSEMTRMIGMFTSAGVSLNKSVSTIKGMANAAALVGANTQRAEMAWRAVSRAMSSGKFTALTWKTLEQSNIAGKQFQTVIKDVARVHGVNIDKMIKKEGSFRDTLKKGWLTKDLFAEAMQIMSGELTAEDLRKKKYSEKQIKELMSIAKSAEEAATRVKSFKQLVSTTAEAVGSGWAQSFRILIGDLQQARMFYTRISETLNAFIDNNAKIRNELFTQIIEARDKDVLGAWRSGRDNLNDIVENMTATIITFLKSVKTGFLNIFPIERISAAVRKVLDIFQRFTRIFVLNASEIDKNKNKVWNTTDIDKLTKSIKDLIRFFRGLASILDIIWMAISQPIKVIIQRIPFLNNFFSNAEKSIKGILDGLGKFGDKITVFRNAVKDTNIFGAALEYVIYNFEELVEESPFLYVIVDIFKSIKNAIVGVKDAFSNLEIKPLTTIFGALKYVVVSIWRAVNNLFGMIKDASISIDWSWLEGPKQFIVNLLKVFDAYGKGLITFEEATEKISSYFGDFWSNLMYYVQQIPFAEIFGTIYTVVKGLASSIINVIKGFFGVFNKEVGKNNKVVAAIGKAEETFSNIGKIANNVTNTTTKMSSGIDKVTDGIKNLSDTVSEFNITEWSIFKGLDDVVAPEGDLEEIGEATKRGIDDISDVVVGGVTDGIDRVGTAAVDSIEKNEQKIAKGPLAKIKDFIKSFGENLKKFTSGASGAIDDLGKKVLVFGGGLTLASLGIKKIVRTVQSIRVVSNLNNLLTSGVYVLRAYQKEIASKAILNIALAIGILAGAMAALSFIPYERLEKGFVIFSSFMGVLALTLTPIIKAIAKLNEALGKNIKVTNQFDVMNNAVEKVGVFLKKIAKGINARMIGKMFKDIAIAVLILVGAMIALKLAFKKPEDIIVPLVAIAGTIVVVTAAVGGLLLLTEAFIKSVSNLRPSVAIFGSFFKLAGVSKVIISISVAIVILVGAIVLLAKAYKKYDLVPAIVTIGALLVGLSVIAGMLTVLSTNADSDKKIKRVTLSITGALLGIAIVLAVVKSIGDPVQMAVALGGISLIFASIAVIIGLISKIKVPTNIDKLTTLFLTITLALVSIAAAMGALVLIIANNSAEAWAGSLITMKTMFAMFSALITVILVFALKINQKKTIWNNLYKISTLIAFISGAIASIAASIYIMGKADPIDPSAFALLSSLMVAIGVIVSIALIISSAKINSKFIRTLQELSIMIAAIVSSFGLVLLGVAALTNAFNQLSVPSKDVTKAASIVVDKITSVVYIISNALPELIRLFGRLGKMAGKIFVAFISALIDSVVSASTVWIELAETVVDSVLDLLERVIDKLYDRREQIAEIVRKALSVFASVITGLINEFFLSGPGQTQVQEDIVKKWLGLGTVLIVLGAFSKQIIGLAKGLWIVIGPIFKGIGKLYYSAFAKMMAATGASKAAVIADLAAISVAVTAVVATLAATVKAFKIAAKGETDALNAAYTNAAQVMTDKTALVYSFIFGMAKLGRYMCEAILAVARTVGAVVSELVHYLLEIITYIPRAIMGFWGGMFNGSNVYIQTIQKATGKTVELNEKVKSLGDGLSNASKGMEDLSKSFDDNAVKWIKDIPKGFKEAGNDANISIFGAKENWYNEAYDASKNATAGALAGLTDYYEEISGKLSADNKKIIQRAKDDYGIRSPSTVFCEIYKNVMLGAAKGLKKGTPEYEAAIKKINKDSINAAKNSAASLEKMLKQLGLEQVDVARKLTFNIKDYNTGAEKTVSLNRKVVEAIEGETEALKGKTRQQAIDYLTSQLAAKGQLAGIENSKQAITDAIDTLFNFQDSTTKITQQGLENLSYNTKATIQELVGTDVAANNLIATDAYQRYTEIEKLAEEHKDEIVGMKKNEVKELLYNAAIEQGMSKEGAIEAVNAVVDEMFKGKKAKEKISAQELEGILKNYKNDITAFEELENFKTALANKNAEIRDKIAAEESAKKLAIAGLEAKKMKEINDGTWNRQKELQYQADVSKISAPYDKRIKNYKQDLKNWTDMYTDKVDKQLKKAQKDLKISDKDLKKRQKEMKNMLNSNKTNNRGKFQSIIDMFKQALGKNASEPNYNPWDLPNTNNGNKNKNNDKDAINKAKDTKKKLEDQRADLTPTFDLDKLASEANKANGIVMSSLMAAQNASIADYINTDSELNPFMKDRWQNVYNFTQNNYSPKALSRIDIYRQTERQISMSRGF